MLAQLSESLYLKNFRVSQCCKATTSFGLVILFFLGLKIQGLVRIVIRCDDHLTEGPLSHIHHCSSTSPLL